MATLNRRNTLQATGELVNMNLNGMFFIFASTNNRKRKNLETSLIALEIPSLNNKLKTKLLYLFRNGVTQAKN